MADQYGGLKAGFPFPSDMSMHAVGEACLQKTLKPCVGDQKSSLSISRLSLQLPIGQMHSAVWSLLSEIGWSAALLGTGGTEARR